MSAWVSAQSPPREPPFRKGGQGRFNNSKHQKSSLIPLYKGGDSLELTPMREDTEGAPVFNILQTRVPPSATA